MKKITSILITLLFSMTLFVTNVFAMTESEFLSIVETGDVTAVKEALEENYDVLGISLKYYNGYSDSKKEVLFNEITGVTYSNITEFEKAFNKVFGKGNGSVGGGGGSSSGIYYVKYDCNGGEIESIDENYTITTNIPSRIGYIFLGWATTIDASEAEYQPGETITINGNITFYAVWEAITSLKIEKINSVFLVTPTGVPENSDIIFACYSKNTLVYTDVFTYEGSDVVPFVLSTECDTVKVMTWDGLGNMIPLCEAEKLTIQ